MKMKTSVRQTAEAVTLRMPWLRLILGDLYDISGRIREIEDGYFVLFDTRRGEYQVHSAYNKGSTYCFTVPYDALDARTLDYCERTLARNKDRIMNEIEKHNKAIEEGRKNKMRKSLEDASYETADEIALAQLKDELHSGYRRTFGGIAYDK